MAATTTARDKTVFVLGAGASLAEAIGHHPKRDRDHPPLDRNFFARAAGRNRVKTQTSQAAAQAALLNRVSARAQGLGVPDLVGQTPAVSLEEYMGRLFYDMNASARTQNIEAYYDLVRLYNLELLATTNWMVGRNGLIRRVLQRELSAADVSIVTFNHDLLAENAIATLPATRHQGAWCFTHAYGLSGFKNTLSDGTDAYAAVCPGNRDAHIRIFKLHGSCNWVYQTRNRYPSPHVARGDRSLYLWTNKQLSQSTQMRTGSSGRSSWYMWPHIIPPIYEKHSYITGDLKRVWDDAGDALAAATKVVFWGYSFPRADLHARYFFTALSQSNDALKTPILINPDPRAQDELWAVLQPRSVLHYRDVTTFLAT